MGSRRIVKMIVAVLVVLFALLGIAVGAVLWSVSGSFREFMAMAQQAHPHPGDDLAALAAYVESEDHSLDDRNHAVWTLGRLSDPRALPALAAARFV